MTQECVVVVGVVLVTVAPWSSSLGPSRSTRMILAQCSAPRLVGTALAPIAGGMGVGAERCAWVDYSARNQVLLASYGVVGPVAGAATWERVASTESGRNCAVRAGEHGLPSGCPSCPRGRPPASGPAREPPRVGSPRTALGSPSSRSNSSLAGLHPSTLNPVAAPKLLAADSMKCSCGLGRVLGRTPRKVSDPEVQLASLAFRVTHGAGRVRLPDELAARPVGWPPPARTGLRRDAGPRSGGLRRHGKLENARRCRHARAL